MYKEGSFTFDMVPKDGPYKGFYDPSINWNGFKCPKFTYDQACRVLRDIVQINQADFIPGAIWGYSEREDFFFIAYPISRDYPYQDNLWIMKGEMIDNEGTPVKVYDIGSYGWSWILDDEE